jgi:hypothetical protein
MVDDSSQRGVAQGLAATPDNADERTRGGRNRSIAHNYERPSPAAKGVAERRSRQCHPGSRAIVSPLDLGVIGRLGPEDHVVTRGKDGMWGGGV